MKTKIAMAVMFVGGVAAAQPAKTTDAAKKDAPTKTTTTTTTTTEPVKGAPAGDAAKKAPAGTAQIKAPETAPMMSMKPAPEIADMAKAMAGNWKCTGKVAMDPSNPTAMTDMKGTYKATLDLDKYWIKGEWTATMGKIKGRGYTFATYDAAAKKWYRHGMDNMGMGGHETSTGLPAGAKEGKLVWEGEGHMMGMTMKGRSTEEIGAKSVKITSEMSMDGGKKWVTGMEMTCTK
ncbi:MAG TPA: DUF1579 family protein [Kofleriaceae bacterium]|nr:DUF1579 family protein [Kofleriaceae bacterium]